MKKLGKTATTTRSTMVAAIAGLALAAPLTGTGQAATSAVEQTAAKAKTGAIKICQHDGGDGRLRAYAEGRSGRSAELTQGRCVTWTGIKPGKYEIGYDSIGGNCTEESYLIDRVTVHRPGSLRAQYYLPVITHVQAGQTTAVGVYMFSTC